MNGSVENKETKECPHCAETILKKAKICRHCKRSVEMIECPHCAEEILKTSGVCVHCISRLVETAEKKLIGKEIKNVSDDQKEGDFPVKIVVGFLIAVIIIIGLVFSLEKSPPKDSGVVFIWSEKSRSSIIWDEAGKYCENLEESGYSDWRLPTISELRTLIKNCPATGTGGECKVTDDCLSESCWTKDTCWVCSVASDSRYSKLGDTGGFWSSSSYVDNTSSAWVVDFYSGGVGSYGKTNDTYARCVR